MRLSQVFDYKDVHGWVYTDGRENVVLLAGNIGSSLRESLSSTVTDVKNYFDDKPTRFFVTYKQVTEDNERKYDEVVFKTVTGSAYFSPEFKPILTYEFQQLIAESERDRVEKIKDRLRHV